MIGGWREVPQLILAEIVSSRARGKVRRIRSGCEVQTEATSRLGHRDERGRRALLTPDSHHFQSQCSAEAER